MPIHDIECLNCSYIDEVILDTHSFDGKNSSKVNLSKLNIGCKRCGNTTFKKLVSVPGRLPYNWGSWNRS